VSEVASIMGYDGLEPLPSREVHDRSHPATYAGAIMG